VKPFIQDSFRGGVSDENDKGVKGSFKFGYGLDIHSRDDVLKCKQAMLKESGTTIGSLMKYFVAGSDGSTYCFGSTGSIYVRSGDTGDPAYTYAFGDENGEIKGAHEWKESSGDNYIYWATNTCIARKLFPGNDALPWADAVENYKVVLEAANYHTMEQASGKLMIGNKNFLAFIGWDGSFTPEALNLRPHNFITCLEERDDYVIMGSYREDNSEKGHIWSWITTALNWIQKKKIPVKGVNVMIQTELMLLQGGSDGELFASDFVNMTPLHAFIGGGEVNPGAVSIEDDIAVFGVYNNSDDYDGIWSYGRKRKNRPFALNYDYRLSPTAATGSTITEIGAIEMVNGVLIASWKTTDGSTLEYGIDCASSTTKATAIFESLEFDGGMPHLRKFGQIVKLIMAPMPASCAVSVKAKMDKAATWTALKMGDGTTSFSVTNATEAEFILPDDGKIYEIQITLTPSANTTPEILDVVVYIADEQEEF
jgi:hypothetical protein